MSVQVSIDDLRSVSWLTILMLSSNGVVLAMAMVRHGHGHGHGRKSRRARVEWVIEIADAFKSRTDLDFGKIL
jgi:hypothetical protein